jgi:hypothetical protein
MKVKPKFTLTEARALAFAAGNIIEACSPKEIKQFYAGNGRDAAAAGNALRKLKAGIQEYIDATNAKAKAEEEAEPDPEKRLRKLWDRMKVPKAKQDAIIREVEEKAKPGAMVGPFKIGDRMRLL